MMKIAIDPQSPKVPRKNFIPFPVWNNLRAQAASLTTELGIDRSECGNLSTNSGASVDDPDCNPKNQRMQFSNS
jgi:hypothetical protein